MHVHPYVHEKKQKKKCTGIRNKAIIYIEFVRDVQKKREGEKEDITSSAVT